MSSYPPAPRPFWNAARAVSAARVGLQWDASAEERVRGQDAVEWIEQHMEDLRRRVREAEATKEIPTP